MPGDGASGVKPDHPRVGGEKTATDIISGEVKGSPPRGRGKVLDVVGFVGFLRITPAWAGKSCRKADHLPRWRDHPRVGGEKTKKIP